MTDTETKPSNLIGKTITEELPRWALIHSGKICDVGISPEKVMVAAMDRIGTNKWSKVASLGFRLARVRLTYMVEAVMIEDLDYLDL